MSHIPLQPNFHLNDEGYNRLVREESWKINDIPLSKASKIKAHFGIDTSFCVLASGVAPARLSKNHGPIIAGIDWVLQESKPRPAEKPLNIYHYVIGPKTDEGYPVYHMGKNDTIAPHWSDLDDLKVYWHSNP